MTSIIDPVKVIANHKYGMSVDKIFVTMYNWSDTLRGISKVSENQNTGKKT